MVSTVAAGDEQRGKPQRSTRTQRGGDDDGINHKDTTTRRDDDGWPQRSQRPQRLRCRRRYLPQRHASTKRCASTSNEQRTTVREGARERKGMTTTTGLPQRREDTKIRRWNDTFQRNAALNEQRITGLSCRCDGQGAQDAQVRGQDAQVRGARCSS